MTDYIRNTGAVFAGVIIGGVLNMALLVVGSALIPAPAGVDVTDMESIAAAMDMGEFGPRHFITPFLAHALGCLAGAIIAYLIAVDRKQLFAYVIGGFFFLGGLINAFMLPAPLWFIVFDLVFAYFPMAWLAGLIARQFGKPKAADS